MGTDRSRVYEESCLCGAGTIEVDQCEPDHPYRTASEWWDGRINCDKCRETYALFELPHGIEPKSTIAIVKQTDIRSRSQKKEQCRTAWARIENSETVQRWLSRLVAHLREQKSAAAVHRALVASGLELGSIQRFRRRYRRGDEEALVMDSSGLPTSLSSYGLPKLMEFLGVEDKAISDGLRKLTELETEARGAPTPVKNLRALHWKGSRSLT